MAVDSNSIGTKKDASTWNVFREYARATCKYPGWTLVVLVGLTVSQIAYVVAPIYLGEFITNLSQFAPTPENAALLLLPLALFGVFEFLAWVGHRTEHYGGSKLVSRVMADLTNRAFGYLLRHSYQFFSSSFAGALTRRVTRYSRAYEDLFDSVFVAIVPAILFISGILIVLALKSALLASVLLAATVLFVAFQWLLIRLQQPLRRKRAEEDSNVTAAVADAIGNHTTIQLFAGNTMEEARAASVVERFRSILERVWVREVWVYGSLGLFSLGINIALLYIGMRLWQKGLLAVGDFVLIQSYLFRLMEHVWRLGHEFRSIFTAVADAGEMVEILEAKHDIQDAPNAAPLKVSKGEIRFSAVGFRFNDGKEVLRDFSISIAGGQKVALVGPSGAGKSTVTKLLLRLYDVKSGSIRIDGQDIANVTQDSLRAAIAFVPQEPVLFHRTLLENIRYGKPDATDEEVIEAAKKAHCHEFIANLKDGYGTFVGERGIKLSGGERQRVAIARAILKDAPLLVLDEATSSLDSESEALIQDALRHLMQGKTVIVIAHRLSTIMKMDRILVVENGRVVADGTHAELLERDGLYQKLWNIQAGGFLLDDGETEKEESEDAIGEAMLADKTQER